MTRLSPATVTAEQVVEAAAAEHEHVTAEHLGDSYTRLLREGGPLPDDGAWYTPGALAGPVTRLSLGAALRSVGPGPGDVLRLVVCDPSCGAGIFLAYAARQLSAVYASRLVGGEPSGDLVLAVMPRIVLECVYGVDIDPVAVDLARLALELETSGAVRAGMLTRHVVAGDTLAGDTTAGTGRAVPAAHLPPSRRGRPWLTSPPPHGPRLAVCSRSTSAPRRCPSGARPVAAPGEPEREEMSNV